MAARCHRRAIFDLENNKKNWLRYQGTWFAGVRVLKNDNRGIVNNGPELDINSSRWALKQLKVKNVKWDPAQVSVCYPGYPMPSIFAVLSKASPTASSSVLPRMS